MAASVAKAASVNQNDDRRLVGNCVRIFLINGKPVFINGSRKLKNPFLF